MENANANNLTKLIIEIRNSQYAIASIVLLAIGAVVGVHAVSTPVDSISTNHLLLEYVGMFVFFMFSISYETKYRFNEIEKQLERKNEG